MDACKAKATLKAIQRIHEMDSDLYWFRELSYCCYGAKIENNYGWDESLPIEAEEKEQEEYTNPKQKKKEFGVYETRDEITSSVQVTKLEAVYIFMTLGYGNSFFEKISDGHDIKEIQERVPYVNLLRYKLDKLVWFLSELGEQLQMGMIDRDRIAVHVRGLIFPLIQPSLVYKNPDRIQKMYFLALWRFIYVSGLMEPISRLVREVRTHPSFEPSVYNDVVQEMIWDDKGQQGGKDCHVAEAKNSVSRFPITERSSAFARKYIENNDLLISISASSSSSSLDDLEQSEKEMGALIETIECMSKEQKARVIVMAEKRVALEYLNVLASAYE